MKWLKRPRAGEVAAFDTQVRARSVLNPLVDGIADGYGFVLGIDDVFMPFFKVGALLRTARCYFSETAWHSLRQANT